MPPPAQYVLRISCCVSIHPHSLSRLLAVSHVTHMSMAHTRTNAHTLDALSPALSSPTPQSVSARKRHSCRPRSTRSGRVAPHSSSPIHRTRCITRNEKQSIGRRSPPLNEHTPSRFRGGMEWVSKSQRRRSTIVSRNGRWPYCSFNWSVLEAASGRTASVHTER